MSPALRSTLAAFVLFTVYFVAGSLVSDSMRFPYGYISLGALVLFLFTGFFIARHYSVVAAGVTTSVAALLASLAAWAFVAFLNPARAAMPRPQTDAIGEVVVLMTGAALAMGFAGAWLATVRPGSH